MKTDFTNCYNAISKPNLWLILRTVIVFIGLLYGCSSGIEEPPIDELVPIQVCTGMSAEVDVLGTRAASTINTNGAKMGVFRIAEVSKGYTAMNNVEYTYSISTSTWSNAVSPILVGGLAASLCAYYPYGASPISGTTASLSAQKYDAVKDLCFATSGGSSITNKNPTATFAMQRAYARIQMSIRSGKDPGVACAISNINLRNGKDGSFYTASTLNISDGTATPTTNAGGGFSFDPGITALSGGDTNTATDLLLPPQAIANGLYLSLTVDGASRSILVPAAQFDSASLLAGKQYVIKLAIIDPYIYLEGNVTIIDYVNSGISIDGGEHDLE